MIRLSRRRLAVYAADKLLQKVPLPVIAEQLASVLIISQRVNQTELLARDIAWELERSGEIANATVTSAHALTKQLRQQIAGFIKKSVGVKRVIISESIDPNAIGGFRIDTAAHSWERTLGRKLEDLREVI